MNGRRAGAFLIAAVLIVGAWAIRTQVIDGDDAGSSNHRATTVVCITELAAACNQKLASRTDISYVSESVDVTLARLADEQSSDPVVWITTEPFPAMVNSLRTGRRLEPIVFDATSLASSPVTLVVAADRGDSLIGACGTPVEWRCLGELAGGPWTDADPGASTGVVRPAFAPHPDTAIGQISVANAVLGYFDGAPLTSSDTGFITWTRGLSGATDERQLGGQTAIARIQTRVSFADIAVGAAAELNNPDDARFMLLATEDALTVEVTAVAANTSLPNDIVEELRSALSEAGWGAPDPGVAHPSAADMLLIRTLWEELT